MELPAKGLRVIRNGPTTDQALGDHNPNHYYAYDTLQELTSSPLIYVKECFN